MKNYQKLIISVLIPLSVGFLGSFFTSSSVESWYLTLNKPEFNPPNWLFAPVWTFLFILMGVSFYLVWKIDFGGKRNSLIGIYSFQLSLNLLWSLLFFGIRNPFFALVEIIFLWFAIMMNVLVFYKASKNSGLLLIPYLMWVSFASVLNYFVVILN
ncbi:MAG: TspO/MBR family protein [Candidatus Aenigmatarchaeota archaeon]